MKVIQRPQYEAFDGKIFDSEAACLDYEAGNITARFVGLTREQVELAFDRTDESLADAFENFGKEITKKRIASGELRRRVKPKDVPVAPAPVPHVDDIITNPPPDKGPADDESDRLVPRYEEAGGF